jgi:hypothetical protein
MEVQIFLGLGREKLKRYGHYKMKKILNAYYDSPCLILCRKGGD